MSRKKLFAITASFLMTWSQANGDDTEIYTQDDTLGVNPNVLFIIDTSASMNGAVNISTYDPATTYSAPGGSTACNPANLYVGGIDASHPPCTTDYQFNKNKFRCEAAEVNLDLDNNGVGTGFFIDKVAQWDNVYKGWYTLDSWFDNYDSQSPHYECRQDDGVHGQTDSSSATHIAWGTSGPWSTSANNSLWNSINTRTIFSANYLNWYHYNGGSSGTVKTRLEIVVDAAKDLIDSVSGINVGLVRFDSTGTYVPDTQFSDWGATYNNHGGPVSHEMVDVGVTANKTSLKSALDNFTDDGSTPLVEAVSEGLRYMRGESVHFGSPLTDGTLASVANSHTGGTYNSPIENDCGKNYMIVFTDGAPTADYEADGYVNNLISGINGDMGSCSHGTDSYFAEADDDSCLDELANYMLIADQATDTLGNDLPGLQNIVSYYIGGFNAADDALLDAAAEKGGTEQSYSASNPSEFASAFNEIISQIHNVNAAFASPAVSVNALNRLRHNNDLYFALFEPERKPHWNGNVKKYRLETTGNDLDGDGEPDVYISDANGAAAVNATTGLFEDTSLSYWNLDPSDPDGNTTSKGGAAHRLFNYDATTGYDADSRQYKVFTYLQDYAPDATEFDGTGITLTPIHEDNADASILGEDGTHITKGSFDLPDSFDDDEFMDRVKWTRGVDVLDNDKDGNTTEGRPIMGAVLHTEPVLVNIAIDDKGTTDPSDDEQTNIILATTNDGYFHIFKSEDDSATLDRMEHSAVVPRRTLKEIDIIYRNSGSDVEHRLDSNIEVWRVDYNGDDQITTAGGDHLYAYFGQRRGGRSVFAFDITDVNAPKLLWEINGDLVSTASTDADVGPFKYLGETWSKPKQVSILVRNSTGTDLELREAIIFGGGYDSHLDDVADVDRDTDNYGNAIYIVDAVTGELIWWAGPTGLTDVTPDLELPDMQYGFASDIRVADLNGDGVMDKFFATDGGGQVWRFDINNAVNAGDPLYLSDRLSGGVIADLQLDDELDSETSENNRRLYYAPDVAIIQKNESDIPYLSVSVGSGFRARPLNKEIHDKLFVLKYDDILSKPTSYSAVKLYVDDLLDVTDLNFASATPDTLTAAEESLLENHGWYIDLEDDGEKSLSESITVAGSVIFTSYTPPDNTGTGALTQVCGGNQGAGKVYAIDIYNGSPIANLDGLGSDTDLELTDRTFNLKVSGIPPKPKLVFPDIDGVSGKIIVGREILPINVASTPDLTYWVKE